MELLAPAGGFSQLEAAIKFGADAVYLAADRFGMRARATNFSLSDIPRAVESEQRASGVGVVRDGRAARGVRARDELGGNCGA